jgi:tetratricopeptide (TPR) repeat protein
MHLEHSSDWANVLTNLCIVYRLEHRLEEADGSIVESLALARRLDNPLYELTAILSWGETAFARGDPRRAIRIVEEGLVLCKARRHIMAEIHAQSNLAGYHFAVGEFDAARRAGHAALQLYQGSEPAVLLPPMLHLAAVAAMKNPTAAARLKGYYDVVSAREELATTDTEASSYRLLTSALEARFSAKGLAQLTHEGALLADDRAAEPALSVS